MTGHTKKGESQPETVLLAVTGMSPAILTETVWALAHEKPPVIPDRVVVVTTSEGRPHIIRELFAPSPLYNHACVWEALRCRLAALGLPVAGRLRFGDTPDDIRVFTAFDTATGRSRELADIRTPEENEAAADFILEQVRQFTHERSHGETRLVASIAGGRKTMGALLYAALSLLGRPGDRLTHVLVREPFENPGLTPRFHFPAKPPLTHELKDRGGKVLSRHSSDEACPQLADVPFVRLRRLFLRDFGSPAGSFRDLVNAGSREIERLEVSQEPPAVDVDESRGLARIDGHEFPLKGREFPVFCFLLERARRGEPCLANHDLAGEPFKQFLAGWQKRHPEIDLADWHKRFDPDDLRGPLSAMRRRLHDMGLERHEPFLFPRRSPLGFQINKNT